MKIVLLILLLTVVAGASGCKSASGSREFTPGRGWQTNG